MTQLTIAMSHHDAVVETLRRAEMCGSSSTIGTTTTMHARESHTTPIRFATPW